MTLTRLIVLCVSLTAKEGHGYIPSQHPSDRARVDNPNLRKVLSRPKAPPPYHQGRRKVQIKPVLRTNPLEQLQVRQDGLAKSTAKPGPYPRRQQELTAEPTSVIAPNAQEDHRQTIFAATSAALAGFTDVLCLAQFGCFVNMMTGNLLKMTTAVANCQVSECLVHALVVLGYMAGVSIFSQLKGLANRLLDGKEGNSDLDPLRLVAPLVAILFACADVLGHRWGSLAWNAKTLQVPLLAVGFGVVNTAASHAMDGTIFFALTGHLTKIANQLCKRENGTVDAATRKSMCIVPAFMGGALLAALVKGATATLPLCTTLGLMYAALFGWYAPLSPLLRLWLETSKVGRIISLMGSRIRPARTRSGRWEQKPALIPSPILVDIFPSQDLLYASDATRAGLQLGHD